TTRAAGPPRRSVVYSARVCPVPVPTVLTTPHGTVCVMSSRIEYRAVFEHGIREVFGAQSDETALRERLRRLGGKHAELREHEWIPDGVRYTLLQGIGMEQLPPAVRSLREGDLVVRREQHFEAADAGYHGHATVTVEGIPGKITARTGITPEGEGTVQRTTGEATVRIPLVGGKLESVIAEQVTKLLRKEAEFVTRWLAHEQ